MLQVHDNPREPVYGREGISEKRNSESTLSVFQPCFSEAVTDGLCAVSLEKLQGLGGFYFCFGYKNIFYFFIFLEELAPRTFEIFYFGFGKILLEELVFPKQVLSKK